jgi:hypothetical protein
MRHLCSKRSQFYKNKLYRQKEREGEENKRLFKRIAAIKSRLDKKMKWETPNVKEKIDAS